MAVTMTTVDNPYNPFKDFDAWYDYDMRCGYSTSCLLARLLPKRSDNLPDAYQDEIEEQIIDRYVKMFPLTYAKIVDDSVDVDYDSIEVPKEDDDET